MEKENSTVVVRIFENIKEYLNDFDGNSLNDKLQNLIDEYENLKASDINIDDMPEDYIDAEDVDYIINSMSEEELKTIVEDKKEEEKRKVEKNEEDLRKGENKNFDSVNEITETKNTKVENQEEKYQEEYTFDGTFENTFYFIKEIKYSDADINLIEYLFFSTIKKEERIALEKIKAEIGCDCFISLIKKALSDNNIKNILMKNIYLRMDEEKKFLEYKEKINAYINDIDFLMEDLEKERYREKIDEKKAELSVEKIYYENEMIYQSTINLIEKFKEKELYEKKKIEEKELVEKMKSAEIEKRNKKREEVLEIINEIKSIGIPIDNDLIFDIEKLDITSLDDRYNRLFDIKKEYIKNNIEKIILREFVKKYKNDFKDSNVFKRFMKLFKYKGLVNEINFTDKKLAKEFITYVKKTTLTKEEVLEFIDEIKQI